MSDKVPADGFHKVDMPLYLAWPLWSASMLNVWRTRTPKYARWLLDEGHEDSGSAAARLGSLTHTAILEPDLLEELYVCEPEPDGEVFRTDSGKPSRNPRATKAFKDAVSKLEATGKQVVSHEQFTQAIEMRDAVHVHSAAAALLQGEGPVEVSGVVEDPLTGVPLKIRPDKLRLDIGANINLKTSQNPGREAWSVDLFRYRYFQDFAFYGRALKALGFEHRHAIAIAVETSGPLDDRVCVHELDEGTLDAGHQLVELYLSEIASCIEKDSWPGHPQDVRSISLPPWAWAKVDEEIAERSWG